MQRIVAVCRLRMGRVGAWCRREWHRIVAGVVVLSLLWVPGAAVVRKDVIGEGEVFGPIHYWNGSNQ